MPKITVNTSVTSQHTMNYNTIFYFLKKNTVLIKGINKNNQLMKNY